MPKKVISKDELIEQLSGTKYEDNIFVETINDGFSNKIYEVIYLKVKENK